MIPYFHISRVRGKWLCEVNGVVVKMPGASPSRRGLRCYHFMLLLGFEPLPWVKVKTSRAGFEPMYAVCRDACVCGVELNPFGFARDRTDSGSGLFLLTLGYAVRVVMEL
jgi:hypothetical protein